MDLDRDHLQLGAFLDRIAADRDLVRDRYIRVGQALGDLVGGGLVVDHPIVFEGGAMKLHGRPDGPPVEKDDTHEFRSVIWSGDGARPG